jgi:hypothetical protein
MSETVFQLNAIADEIIQSLRAKAWRCPGCGAALDIVFHQHKDLKVSLQLGCPQCNEFYHCRGKFQIPGWWIEQNAKTSQKKAEDHV